MSVGAMGWCFVVILVFVIDSIAFIADSHSMSVQFGLWLKSWTKFPVILGWLALTVHLFWGLFR